MLSRIAISVLMCDRIHPCFIAIASSLTSANLSRNVLQILPYRFDGSCRVGGSKSLPSWRLYYGAVFFFFYARYLKDITVVNRAIGGRSARSYWREGRWTSVQNSLKAGDCHNDGGSPRTSDRASVGGEGSETQTVTLADGTVETVYTWPTYVGWMIDGAKSKGATVIISAQTPNNPYENRDTISNSPTRFVTYAKNVAAKKGVPYVDHFAAGANQVAWAFLSGLQCPAAAGVLKQYVNDVGKGAGARWPTPIKSMILRSSYDVSAFEPTNTCILTNNLPILNSASTFTMIPTGPCQILLSNQKILTMMHGDPDSPIYVMGPTHSRPGEQRIIRYSQWVAEKQSDDTVLFYNPMCKKYAGVTTALHPNVTVVVTESSAASRFVMEEITENSYKWVKLQYSRDVPTCAC
ncbi:hypothetical protein AG1IA_03184 [Rhizoctonia solani AG-1 IA]|uniref:Uncharacterized protein n=1 Tax=Thanatephorus cucumeris (strain AG1-IA) TaxID=983506 RepID=L8X2G2_THACA|nr:hypothetical protein AG1IA_03184 [Rhizoctonia solani AG-1 IA]